MSKKTKMTEFTDKALLADELVARIRQVFDENRESWINAISNNLPATSFEDSFTKTTNINEAEHWLIVSSLSGLRKEVGGRFSLLKSRWLACGFPLKSSRGGEKAYCKLIDEGWHSLAGWLREAGFEARLLPQEDERGFFEIRPSG
jgi:hypothetical protein